MDLKSSYRQVSCSFIWWAAAKIETNSVYFSRFNQCRESTQLARLLRAIGVTFFLEADLLTGAFFAGAFLTGFLAAIF